MNKSSKPLFSVASVVLDCALDKPLDYSIPEDLLGTIQEGMRVKVPLKNSLQEGTILSLKTESAFSSLKPLNQLLSKALLSKELFQLALWMEKYYCCSLSKVLKCFIPTSVRKDIHPKYQTLLLCTKSKKDLLELHEKLRKTFPLQAKIIELFLPSKKKLFLNQVLEDLKISRSPIDSLIKKKVLSTQKVLSDVADLLYETSFFPTYPKTLSQEQKEALSSVCKSLEDNKFHPHLLYGVTGSGKTEIYLQAMQKALDQKKGVILLVPEIALTSQTIERLKSRFAEKIAIFHHRRSHGERFDAWHKVETGEIPIVLGARSAVFSPVKNLGLIIVDEEHDQSYKNEEMPSYHARNIAVMRGKLEECTVLLASATPSLESYWNAEKGKYHLNILEKRPEGCLLPSVRIVNMQREVQKNSSFYFSEELLSALKERYHRGEQSLLFLNRRGYHTAILCTQCSHIFKCPHCDLALTYHKQSALLSCHLCFYQIAPPKTCPSCGSIEHIKYQGFGTELVERSLKAIFPEIRTLRIDLDTTREKHSHEALFKEFRSGKADVLIGTQMIVKGLHFPSVTLVGVLNSDGALHIPDFRSSESVFQLITQVAGRAGRFLQGEVIIQTFLPENQTILLAKEQNFIKFYLEEIENRKNFSYPPFTSITKCVFSGTDEEDVKELAERFRHELISHLPSHDLIHPVVAAGRPKVQDHYYYFFLIRGKNNLLVSEKIEKARKNFSFPSSVYFSIDVDPISTFF